MPSQIEQMFPDLWVDEESEEGKNLNEAPLIQTQIDRFRKKYTFSYNKVHDSQYGEKLLATIPSLTRNQLNVIVLNFVDMLSHARTESKMIRELAQSEAAYRSLTKSWFQHSSTLELFKRIAERGAKVIVTTDHGTIRVTNPIKVIGDKNTNTNLRYKVGKNLNYNPKEVFEIRDPEKVGLPSPNLAVSIFSPTERISSLIRIIITITYPIIKYIPARRNLDGGDVGAVYYDGTEMIICRKVAYIINITNFAVHINCKHECYEHTENRKFG